MENNICDMQTCKGVIQGYLHRRKGMHGNIMQGNSCKATLTVLSFLGGITPLPPNRKDLGKQALSKGGRSDPCQILWWI